MSLLSRVAERCRRGGLLPQGETVAVAVSGGLDSVVLLDLLLRLRPMFRIELVVATVDHGLRPGASAYDAAFVRSLAAARGLPCYCGRFCGPVGRGLEDGARRERAAFLRSVPARRVALAHHLDDQAETVLLRALRGAGISSLCAMRARRARLVRPLLGEPRRELESWARERGLRWREDASNLVLDRERNRLRHAALPELERVHGGAAARLAGLASNLGADADLLDQLEQSSWATLYRGGSLPRAPLRSLAPSLQLRLLRRLVLARRGSIEGLGSRGLEAGVELAARGGPGDRVPLPGAWRLAVDDRRVYALPPPPLPLRLRLPGPRAWGIYRILLVSPFGSWEPPLLLRGPLRGENWRGSSLAEWLRGRGVAAPLRPYHPVFCVGERIIWLPPGPSQGGADQARGLAMHVSASIGMRDAVPHWNATL